MFITASSKKKMEDRESDKSVDQRVKVLQNVSFQLLF